jgi:guanylate kinase
VTLKKTKGILFVVSGPSGSGKTTLAAAVMADPWIRRHVRRSVSLTTRPKRSGERRGRDYFFVSRGRFLALRRAKKILEWTSYLRYYYATPKDAVDAQLAKGRHLILCLDLRGGRAIKKMYPGNSVTVFVMPPSLGVLKERIRKRCGKTSPEEIEKRLALAAGEMVAAESFDYCVLNEDLAHGVKALKKIITVTIKK